MRCQPHTWGEPAPEKTGADRVTYCPILVNGRPCGSPVVSAPGKMAEHQRRCHLPHSPAKSMPGIQRWQMEWK